MGVQVNYEDSEKVFTPEQIIACMLSKVLALFIFAWLCFALLLALLCFAVGLFPLSLGMVLSVSACVVLIYLS